MLLNAECIISNYINYVKTSQVHGIYSRKFLGDLQRKVWINIFVLDMVQFINDHLRLLEKWEKTFLDSVEGASKRKMAEIDVLMKRIKKSLTSQEEMANKVIMGAETTSKTGE